MLTIEHKLIEGTDEETEGLLHDTIAALYNLWYSSSSLLSPIIGGFLFDIVGYKGTMNLSMVAILIVTAVFFFQNCGFKVYELTAIEMKEIERLKAIKEKIEKIKKGESVEEEGPSPLPEADQSVLLSESEEPTILDGETESDRIFTQINN